MKRGITLCIAVSLCAGVYAGNNPGIYTVSYTHLTLPTN